MARSRQGHGPMTFATPTVLSWRVKNGLVFHGSPVDRRQVILRVLIPEALPSLVRGTALMIIKRAILAATA
jgi:hypothetical protein